MENQRYLGTVVKLFKEKTQLNENDFLMFHKRNEIVYSDTTNTETSYDSLIDTIRRTETGSFYTPYPLAKAMVKIALYDYFDQWAYTDLEALIFMGKNQMSSEESHSFVGRLNQLKIVDIACGTGIFLMAAIEVLSSLYALLKHETSLGHIIRRLYGVDIQREPLEIINIQLLDALYENDEPFVKPNLLHADAITDPLFDETFEIVIGNPPYVGEKGHKEIFDKYKHLLEYEGRMDLFYFFIYRGFRMLSSEGILCQITTNYWVTADSASKLRKYIEVQTRMKRLINLDECKWFSNAKGMHNLIFSLGRTGESVCVNTLKSTQPFSEAILFDYDYKIDQHELFSVTGNILLYESLAYFNILNKIIEASLYTLGQITSINQGIVSGADKVSKSMLLNKLNPTDIKRYHIEAEDPIFVFEEKTLESKLYRPFYKNSQIRSYKLSLEKSRYILYMNETLEEGCIEREHLLPFKSVLSERREVKFGKRKWYQLQWGRDQSIFESEKIVVPQRAALNYFGYTKEPFYASADVYFITNGPLKLLLGILNSKLYYFWLYNRGKRKGQSLELYAKPLSQIPIPNMKNEEKKIIIKYVDEILNGNDKRKELDQFLYKYFSLTDDEIARVEALYPRSDYEKIY